MTEFLPVTLTSSLNRQRYSHELKRQIVDASFVPGASAAGRILTVYTSLTLDEVIKRTAQVRRNVTLKDLF